MISPNFRSGEMRLRDDDDVRDDEEEENKSTSFCATISATGPQYATSISSISFFDRRKMNLSESLSLSFPSSIVN